MEKESKAKNKNSIVKYLLKDELDAIEKEQQDLYDLDTEYAKTSHNKSYFVPKVLFLCIMAVVLITVILSFAISHSTRKIAVNIDVFQDVDLKAMLDMASRTDASYQNAVNKLNELQTALDFALKEASQKRDEDLFTLDSMHLNRRRDGEKRLQIENEYQETCKTLHTDYDIRLETAKKDVEHFKQLLDEYTKTTLKDTQGKMAALNSERQLHQLEITKITKSYEAQIASLEQKLDRKGRDSLSRQKNSITEVARTFEERLDPTIEDSEAQEIKNLYNTDSLAPFNPFSYKNDLVYGTQQSSFYTTLNDIEENEGKALEYIKSNVLTPALQEHQNSIPEYWNLQNKLTTRLLNKVASGAVSTIDDYAIKLKALDTQMEVFNDYFEKKCTLAENAMGLIIDASDLNSMLIYLRKDTAPHLEDLPLEASIVRGTSTSSLCHVNLIIEMGVLIARPIDEANLTLAVKAKIKEGDKLQFTVPVTPISIPNTSSTTNTIDNTDTIDNIDTTDTMKE